MFQMQLEEMECSVVCAKLEVEEDHDSEMSPPMRNEVTSCAETSRRIDVPVFAQIRSSTDLKQTTMFDTRTRTGIERTF